jgi:hypothetical protein
MFYAPGFISDGIEGAGLVIVFCVSRLIFGGIEGVGSSFYVLRSKTHFGRYVGRRVQFLCFWLPGPYSEVPRVSGPIYMFCAPRIIFNGTDGIGSSFHGVHSRTHFRRCWVCRVHFSYFALMYSFFAVPRSPGRVFIFCAPELIFGCTEGANSSFHVLHSRIRFRQYRGRQLVFRDTEGVGCSLHVLRS